LFASVGEACDWVRERPAFVEVLGVTHRLPSGATAQLQHALRPLDDQEQEALLVLEQRESGFAEATRQIQQAVARGFMLENRWGGPRRSN
jgi:hypothetical protein